MIHCRDGDRIAWSAGGAEDDNPFRVVTWDELDLKLVWNPGGNIVGMSVHTEPLPTTFAFQFNSGAPTHVRRGGTAQSHTPNMGINAYGFWGDRLLTVIGIDAGEENNDWQAENPITGDMERKMNFQGLLAYALMNQDAGRHAEAQASFERVLQIDPDHAEASYNLGLTLKDRAFDGTFTGKATHMCNQGVTAWDGGSR